VPERLVLPNLNNAHGPDFIRGKRVVAFAGIARPEVFRETLIKLGGEITHFRSFRDHHVFLGSEFQNLVAERHRLCADLLITTEKDYVRLGQLAPIDDHLGYLTIRFQMISGAETFFDMIRGKAKEACLRL
jgi:tetraacyldisaccharide 4'-kinase